MSFPISPANNQTALVNGIVYQWNESLGVWKRNGSVDSITVGQLILNSGTESTSNTTGTIIVSGGAGITGNLHTSNIYISGTGKGITFPDGTIQTTAGVAVDSYARTTANAATALAQAAFDSANVIVGVNTTQNTNITSVNQYAAGAYATANGANGLAAGAYAQANTNAGDISIIQGVDLTQNTRITAVDTFAAGAYSLANTKFSSSGGTITGNVTITETLTVSGNITANIISTGSGSSVVSVNSNTFTTSSTSEVSVDSFPSTLYRSAKYQAQMTSGSAYHAIELLLIHDGTTVSLVQYGEVMTGASLGTFNASITGSTLNLLFTATNNVTTVNLFRTSLVV